jgi:hypothetical protein
MRTLTLLMCVALLAALAYPLIPVEQLTWFGINTGRIRTTYSICGAIVSDEVSHGRLTPLLEQYLGPLPNETEWKLAYWARRGLFHFEHDEAYARTVASARLLEILITNERDSQSGLRPFKHGMTIEAQRQCLQQYLLALHEPSDSAVIAEGYVVGLSVMIDGDCDDLVAEVPSLAEYKAYGPKSVEVETALR